MICLILLKTFRRRNVSIFSEFFVCFRFVLLPRPMGSNKEHRVQESIIFAAISVRVAGLLRRACVLFGLFALLSRKCFELD